MPETCTLSSIATKENSPLNQTVATAHDPEDGGRRLVVQAEGNLLTQVAAAHRVSVHSEDQERMWERRGLQSTQMDA